MEETEKAWLAAVIDSEGSIHISKVKASHLKKGYTYRTALSIVNTNRAFIDRTHELIGAGSIASVIPKRRNGQAAKTAYQYMCYGNAVRATLPQVLEFLIVKKEVAFKVLQFLQLIGRQNWYGERYPAEVETLYNEVKELNGRTSKRWSGFDKSN